MSEFETSALLAVEVDQQSLRQTRGQIESAIDSINVGLEDAGAVAQGLEAAGESLTTGAADLRAASNALDGVEAEGGGGGGGRARRRARKEFRWARQRTNDVEELLETSLDIKSLLDEDSGGGMLSSGADILGSGALVGAAGALGGAAGSLTGSAGALSGSAGALTSAAALLPSEVEVTGEFDDLDVTEPEWQPLEVDHPEEAYPLDHPEEAYDVDHPDEPYAVDHPADPYALDHPDGPYPIEEIDPLPVEDIEPIDVDVSVDVGVSVVDALEDSPGGARAGREGGGAVGGGRTPVTDEMSLPEAIVEDVPGSHLLRQTIGPVSERLGWTPARSPQDIAVGQQQDRIPQGQPQPTGGRGTASETHVEVSVETGDTTVEVETENIEILEQAIDEVERAHERQLDELRSELSDVERDLEMAAR